MRIKRRSLGHPEVLVVDSDNLRYEDHNLIEDLAEAHAENKRLRAALQQIAGPWDDLYMKQAQTLHYDMAWWAQRALAAAQEPPADPFAGLADVYDRVLPGVHEFMERHGRLPVDLAEMQAAQKPPAPDTTND